MKLSTPEDKFYFHKVFGLLSLLSFCYHYVHFIYYGNFGFQNTLSTYCVFFIHFILSSSSLIFHVLPKRNPKNPLIIYSEYRLHAILFTLRACGVSLLGLGNYDYVVKYFVLLIHIMVDIVTYLYGTKGITAVRNDRKNLIPKWVQLFFSYYQFMGLGVHLIGNNESFTELGFTTIIAIQSSAFLMTLKRKSLIRWRTHIFFYGLSLILSFYTMTKYHSYIFFLEILFTFFLRTQGINKENSPLAGNTVVFSTTTVVFHT